MQFRLESSNKDVLVWADDVPGDVQKQLMDTASLPIIGPHIAAMPDVHLGKGATVGSVIATRKAIIPSAVGVDIGCGVMACRLDITTNDLPTSLKNIRSRIESKVPVGFNSHRDENKAAVKSFGTRLQVILDKHPLIGKSKKRRKNLHDIMGKQCGTLGGGNHFIELCFDDYDDVWIVLHSGSRGMGNLLGMYFIDKAKEESEKLGRILPHKDLSWLDQGTSIHFDYVEAVQLAQEYAAQNREEMMFVCLDVLKEETGAGVEGMLVNCHHNYVSWETHYGEELTITRKGAISAKHRQLGIIPGSMGTETYIVEGLGNPESFHSSAHGAGRRMSRRKARETFTSEDLEEQTEGIECRKDKGVIDEIPGAYKDVKRVMELQQDLTRPLYTLSQVMNIKG